MHDIVRGAKNLYNSATYEKISLYYDRTVRQVYYYNKIKQQLNDKTGNPILKYAKIMTYQIVALN